MVDTRQRNKDWCCADADGSISYGQARLAVLQDIRDELKSINRFLSCYRIPRALDAIDRIDRLGVKRRVTKKRGKK